MWRAFLNALKVKELRNRLLFTALIIVLVRVAGTIPCPGVDPAALTKYIDGLSHNSDGNFMSLIDLFSGGALENFALGALGIMPYITASIIMQLLVPVIPQLERMQREGESGRQKITQYTRYLTIAVCLVQGFMVALAIIDPRNIRLPQVPAEIGLLYHGSPSVFVPMSVLVLTCTTMVFTWLGEQITERGIGNGVSLIITINIISRLPRAIAQLVQMTFGDDNFSPVHLVLLLAMFGIVTAATIMLSQGYRRVPIQMVRKTVGKQMMGGSTYMPLKVNFANVMPIIFAGAIMMIPEILFTALAQRPDASKIWVTLAMYFRHDGNWYVALYGILIIAFSFFWVANQFNPLQIADNLKKEGAYIPGISPGQATADFLDTAMTRVTAGGAVFLLVLAILPMFLTRYFNIPFMVSQFFGGTSLLIMVGVMLDTMSQLESHLTMRNYDGFLKSGRLRNRSGN